MDEHLKVQFPDDLVSKDIKGIDLALPDSNLAGCVMSFLESKTLNLYQTAILGLSYQSVSLVMPFLDKEGIEYFYRLQRMAELLLHEVAAANYEDHAKD